VMMQCVGSEDTGLLSALIQLVGYCKILLPLLVWLLDVDFLGDEY